MKLPLALRRYRGVSNTASTWLLRVFCAVVLAFLVLPVLVVIPMGFSADRYLRFPPPGYSLQYYLQVASDPAWLAAVRNSFLIGITTAATATLIGTLAALGLMQMQARLRAGLLLFVLSPLATPLIIPAVGLYFMYNNLGLLESFTGMVMAHTLVAAPLVVLVVCAALRSVNPNIERAAAGLGAPPARAFLTATLPAIAPGILTGALFAFITSFDEIILALFLSGARYRTLPVKMFDSIQYDVGLTTAAVGSLFIFVAAGGLITAEVLRRRAVRRRVRHA